MCEISNVFSYISRIWLQIQTANTYLESARLTGSNSTKNIEILQKLTILEPFYGIRNILDSMCEIADADVFSYISRTWLPIQTANTYLESAWLTGSNITTNIEMLKKLTILEPFYGIRNILDRSICAWSSVFSLISPVFDFRFKQQIHIWNLLDWLVLTVPLTFKC